MAKRKMSENSLKNLEKGKPFDKNCEEIARKAQKKSVKKRKEQRLLKDELLLLLAQGDTQERISLALLEKAAMGDTKAFEVIRDTIGQKPKDVIENIAPPIINIKGI